MQERASAHSFKRESQSGGASEKHSLLFIYKVVYVVVV